MGISQLRDAFGALDITEQDSRFTSFLHLTYYHLDNSYEYQDEDGDWDITSPTYDFLSLYGSAIWTTAPHLQGHLLSTRHCFTAWDGWDSGLEWALESWIGLVARCFDGAEWDGPVEDCGLLDDVVCGRECHDSDTEDYTDCYDEDDYEEEAYDYYEEDLAEGLASLIRLEVAEDGQGGRCAYWCKRAVVKSWHFDRGVIGAW